MAVLFGHEMNDSSGIKLR